MTPPKMPNELEKLRNDLSDEFARENFGRHLCHEEIYCIAWNAAYTAMADRVRELEGALDLVVEQFEDMQGTTDIREHWHRIAKQALAGEGGGNGI